MVLKVFCISIISITFTLGFAYLHSFSSLHVLKSTESAPIAQLKWV